MLKRPYTSSRVLALLAALGAATIYGLNHTIAKGVMPTHIGAFGFIQLRIVGATILFWLISFFISKESIDKKDWPRFLICAFFGMGINMLSFFKGLELSTPINSAVLITASPILIFIFSALLLNEKTSFRRIFGILLGLLGALTLIFFGPKSSVYAPNVVLGNALFVVNSATYGLYLVLVKPLTKKYHVITIMKWLFLIGVFIVMPLGLEEFLAVRWTQLPLKEAVYKMLFVVVGTTFMTYLLNMFALEKLKASTVGAFIYLQPLIGGAYAVVVGADTLSILQFVSGLVICLGVYLVGSKASSQSKND